ncbi:MAG: hypothetical protein ACOC3V_01270, partial [bacterium]
KREKAKLHRKSLYYLNKLVKEDLLKISQIKNKNEKSFELNISNENELIFEKNKKNKIIISKPTIPAMPIEGYEQKNIIKKFEEATWISRSNSIIILCKKISRIEKLKEIIIDSFSYVNDGIGINDFETIIEQTNLENTQKFLIEIEQECYDFGKTLSIIIDFSNIKNDNKIKEVMKLYSNLNLKHTNIIFDVSSKEIQKYEELMESIIYNFSKSKLSFRFQSL